MESRIYTGWLQWHLCEVRSFKPTWSVFYPWVHWPLYLNFIFGAIVHLSVVTHPNKLCTFTLVCCLYCALGYICVVPWHLRWYIRIPFCMLIVFVPVITHFASAPVFLHGSSLVSCDCVHAESPNFLYNVYH